MNYAMLAVIFTANKENVLLTLGDEKLTAVQVPGDDKLMLESHLRTHFDLHIDLVQLSSINIEENKQLIIYSGIWSQNGLLLTNKTEVPTNFYPVHQLEGLGVGRGIIGVAEICHAHWNHEFNFN